MTVVRAPLVSGYGGQQVRDWEAASRWTYDGCNVQADTSQEFTDRRDVTVTRWRANLPADATVEPADRVEWERRPGWTFEVYGDPELLLSRGIPHHVELVMTRVVEAST